MSRRTVLKIIDHYCGCRTKLYPTKYIVYNSLFNIKTYRHTKCLRLFIQDERNYSCTSKRVSNLPITYTGKY